MSAVIKVRFPAIASQAVRTFKFTPETTVGEAIERVSDRGLPDTSGGGSGESNGFAFFSRVHGWLPPNSTLQELGFASGAELDCRLKQQKRIVWNGRLESSVAVLWRDDWPIKRNLVEFARQFGSKKLLTTASPHVLRRGTMLNKNEVLLNYPLPENMDFVLIIQDEGWKYTPECSDDELCEKVCFLVLSPFYEGELWKKTATGFRRGWKKLWCVLQRETFSFYPDSSSRAPIGGVHIRNMEFCYQSEAIDAQSKKLGNIFRLGTTSSEKVIYLGVAQKDQLARWIKVISDWIGFCDFFRPKAITERGEALSHILSGQIRPNPKTYPGGETSGIEHQMSYPTQQQQQLLLQQQQLVQANQPSSQQTSLQPAVRDNSRVATSSLYDDGVSSNTGLEVQPNREVAVSLLDGSFREMVVDSRLDVYELAYMIAEEIRSENAFIISPDDFGPFRSLELLDHQASLASQQIPLSAKFSIRKTGIVDDFVKECDIYDNHFLFVALPQLEGQVLVLDEAHQWRVILLRVFAGKVCCIDLESENPILSCVAMRHVLSIYRTPPDLVDPMVADHAFSMALSGDRELHFLANSPDLCDEWCDLDGWCGFNCNNMLLDPTDHYSWKLYDSGAIVENAVSWLGVPEAVILSPRSQQQAQQQAGPVVNMTDISSPAEQLQRPHQHQVHEEQQQQQQQQRSTQIQEDPKLGNSSSSLSPLSSPRVTSPRDGGVVIEQEDEYEEDGAESTEADRTSPRKLSPKRAAAAAVAAKVEDIDTLSSSPVSGGLPDRIKRFDWRKGNSSPNLLASRKRRSVEELVVEEGQDDEGQQDSESSSIAVRVPSDDEDSENGPTSPLPVKKASRSPSSSRLNVVPTHLPSSPQRTTTAADTLKEKPLSGSVSFVSAIPATKESKVPTIDVSRMIRRAYESVEPVKLKALPDTDPSVYCWKVLHSLNSQKLGYASLRQDEVEFFDLRGHRVLSVAKHNLPGLNVPAVRLAKVEKVLAHMRKSSQLDVKAELRKVYELDAAVLLRRARDAEFEFRVVMQDGGDQVGWASRNGLDTLFYDMNGVSLLAVVTESLGSSLLEPAGSSRVMPVDVRTLFKTQEEVTIVNSDDPSARFEYRVLTGNGALVGWGEREAFDFAFFDLSGRPLGRVPLSAMTKLASSDSSAAATKKRSSSGLSTGLSKLGKLKDAKKGGIPTSPQTSKESSGGLARSGSSTGLNNSRNGAPDSLQVQTDSAGNKERKGSTRRLSEWQVKIRTSGPFKPADAAAAGGTKPRRESLDYTPVGLSPELQDLGYDVKSSHKPMGLAGLLGEPDE